MTTTAVQNSNNAVPPSAPENTKNVSSIPKIFARRSTLPSEASKSSWVPGTLTAAAAPATSWVRATPAVKYKIQAYPNEINESIRTEYEVAMQDLKSLGDAISDEKKSAVYTNIIEAIREKSPAEYKKHFALSTYKSAAVFQSIERALKPE